MSNKKVIDESVKIIIYRKNRFLHQVFVCFNLYKPINRKSRIELNGIFKKWGRYKYRKSNDFIPGINPTDCGYSFGINRMIYTYISWKKLKRVIVELKILNSNIKFIIGPDPNLNISYYMTNQHL